MTDTISKQITTKQAILDTINDEAVMLLAVDWLIIDPDTDQCQMTVTFDLKDRQALDSIEDAYSNAMSIVGEDG